MKKVVAPWSWEQVAQLQNRQDDRYKHPYTCPIHGTAPLVAREQGWHCPEVCDYTQDWAWEDDAEYLDYAHP